MLFWRSRYAGRTGDIDRQRSLLQQASREHPWEFYGILAAERLGGEVLDIPFNYFDLSRDPVVLQAVSMMADGYGTMASGMLRDTGRSSAGMRAAALALMGEYSRSISLLRSTDYSLRSMNSGTLPDSLLCIYFPAPYRELTEETVTGVPVSLVTGLMRQESSFNRWAVSWVGASGLIQLMPGTAGDIARWYDLPVLSGGDFFIPDRSILYGSIYLARQYQRYEGWELLALAAYNAGPGNASRWMEEFPFEAEDPELFIEQIPFTETRGYVKHVLANSLIYGRIFER